MSHSISLPPQHVNLARPVRTMALATLGAMIFLPSVTFSLLSAEIFPWALLFVVFFGRRIDTRLLLASLFLVLLTIVVQLAGSEPNVGESLRSLGAYINCLLLFGVLACVSTSDIRYLSKIGRSLFLLLICLGLLQYFGLIGFLEGTLKSLVPRSSSTALEFMGGRGVTLLSSEPARAGIELVSIYLIFRISVKTNQKKIAADFILGIFVLLVIKSAQALGFYLVFMMIFHNFRLARALPVFLIGAVIVYKTTALDGRVVVLLTEIYQEGSLGDMFVLVSNTSGHRITSIVANYQYGFWNPFGGGIGNWMTSSVSALNSSGVDLTRLNYFNLYGGGSAVPIRGSGFLTNLVLDIGLLGIMPILYAIHRLFRRLGAYSKPTFAIVCLFMAKILFFGSVGNPVVWASTIICIRALTEKDANPAKST